MFLRYARRKGFKRFFKENILQSEGSNKNKATSIALGIFIGLTPTWGFQTVIILFLASYFKLNKVLSYLFTHVSLPPFLPVIISTSFFIGAKIIHVKTTSEAHFDMDYIKNHLFQYIVGSLIFAVIAAVFFGLISYFILEIFNDKKSRL